MIEWFRSIHPAHHPRATPRSTEGTRMEDRVLSFLEALLLGLVQGVTEFLPVSSSGHLLLVARLLGLASGTDPEATPMMMSFVTLLHMGTLLAVFVVMRKEILGILRNLKGRLTFLLLLSTLPAVAFALLFGDLVELAFRGGAFLGLAFLLTAAALFASLLVRPGNGEAGRPLEAMNWKDALAAGTGQAIAILPAVSRSGCSLVPLLLRRVRREDAIRYAFLMSIPAILGGFVFDLRQIVADGGAGLSQIGWGNLAAGILAAAVSGYFVMRWMLRLLTRKGLAILGVYVAVLGILILLDHLAFGLVF